MEEGCSSGLEGVSCRQKEGFPCAAAARAQGLTCAETHCRAEKRSLWHQNTLHYSSKFSLLLYSHRHTHTHHTPHSPLTHYWVTVALHYLSVYESKYTVYFSISLYLSLSTFILHFSGTLHCSSSSYVHALSQVVYLNHQPLFHTEAQSRLHAML